jgi:hypothetical protein
MQNGVQEGFTQGYDIDETALFPFPSRDFGFGDVDDIAVRKGREYAAELLRGSDLS